MIKLISIVAMFAIAGGINAKADKKKYCDKEVRGSIKGQKAECAKQKAAAFKAAGKDKDKRKEATDAMAVCAKAAEDSGKTMMQGCMSSSGEGN